MENSNPKKSIISERNEKILDNEIPETVQFEFHSDNDESHFCIQHEQIISNECVADGHKNCSVLPVTSVVEVVEKKTTLQNMLDRIDSIIPTIEFLVQKKEDNIASLRQKSEDIKTEIGKFREKIINKLGILEKKAHKSIESEIQRLSLWLETDKQSLEMLRTKLENSKQEIAEFHGNELDVRTFRKIMEINELQKDTLYFLDSSENLKLCQSIGFQWSDFTNILLQKDPTFGKLVTETTTIKEIQDLLETTQRASVIELYHNSDLPTKDDCQMKEEATDIRYLVLKSTYDVLNFDVKAQINRGCFISKNYLLLKDMKNSCIYLLNIKDETFQKLQLQHEPLDLAAFDDSRAVVTLREGGIQIVDIRIPLLHLGDRIRCDGSFYAVTCMNGEIYARTPYRKLTVFNIEGKHIRTIETEFAIDYMCVSRKGIIYGTNYYRKRVFALTIEGVPIFSCELSSLKGPVGVTTDNNGNVYVSGWISNNIHQIDEDGNIIKIIVSEEDGIYRPMDLSYHVEEDCLMVVNKSCITIEIYQIASRNK